MKKLNLIFSALFLIFINSAVQAGFFNDVFDDVVEVKGFGNEKLSRKNEKFIRSIISEMGMNSYNIKIRKMNDVCECIIGSNNAFAYLNYIFVGEGFFNSLTPGMRRFLIGHELIHIKQYHALRPALESFALSVPYFYLFRFIYNFFSLKEKSILVKYPTYILYLIFTRITGDLIIKYRNRLREFEADRESIIHLGDSIDDATVFLKALERSDFSNLSNKAYDSKLEYLKDKFSAYMLELFSTHPSHKSRIEQLESLLKKY